MIKIAKHTFLQYYRSKELFAQVAIIMACMVFGLFIPSITKQEPTVSLLFRSIYDQTVTILSLILAFIVAPSITDGYEKKEINWYLIHHKTVTQYVLAHFMYFSSVISITVMIVFSLLSVGLYGVFGEMVPLLPTLFLIIPILMFTIAFFLFISCLSPNKGIAVILTICGFFVLMVCNMVLPIVKGYIAPYDINSIQYTVFEQIYNQTFFWKIENIAVMVWPLVYVIGLLGLAIFVLQKRCKKLGANRM